MVTRSARGHGRADLAILKEHEAGVKTADLCRKHGISEASFHNNERPHSRLGWMSPAIYAAARRSAALRSTDGSAPRIAATTAQQGITDDQTPIATG